MAVETKVGLLVGLAFIVCFAVILSNRGSGDVAGGQMAYHLLSRHESGDSDQRQPAAGSLQGRSPTKTSPRRHSSRASSRAAPGPNRVAGGATLPRQRPATRRNGPVTTQKRTSPPQNQRAELPRETTMSATQEPSRGQPVQRSGNKASQRSSPRQQKPHTNDSGDSKNFETIFGDHGSDAPKEKPALAQRKSKQGSAGTSSGLGTKPVALSKSQTRMRDGRSRRKGAVRQSSNGATYEVQKNDTLWKIARKAYGDSKPAIVEAIFEANRDTMKSKDHLRVGRTLRLPDIGGVRPNVTRPKTRVADRTTETKRGDRNSRKSNRGHRYYQIQKGDRYTTIAANLLGDGKRWKEIFELNKDIFPEAGSIQYGVRIRVPLADTIPADTTPVGTR